MYTKEVYGAQFKDCCLQKLYVKSRPGPFMAYFLKRVDESKVI